MNRFLVDTNAYSGFMRGVPAVIEVLTQARHLYFNPVVIGELLAGFKRGDREAGNRRELDAFLHNPRVTEVPIDTETSEFYAQIYTRLRAKGRPIPTNDMWIAASAMQNGLAVCTRDTHFTSIDGLLVLNPSDHNTP